MRRVGQQQQLNFCFSQLVPIIRMELVSELNQSRTGDYPEFVMVCQSFTYLKNNNNKYTIYKYLFK